MAILRDEDNEDERLISDAGAGVAGQGGPTPAQGQAPKDYTKSNYTSGRMIIDKNRTAGQPDLMGGFNEKAQARQANLATQQSAYEKALADKRKAFEFGDSDIDRSISGDAESFNRLKAALAGPGDFGDLNAGVDLDVVDANKLNSSQGVSEELRNQAAKRGNFNYSRGQSALDAAIFNRSGAGAQQAMQAQAKRAEVANQVNAANQQAAKQKEAAGDEVAMGLKRIREALAQRGGDIETGIQNKLLAKGQENRAGYSLAKDKGKAQFAKAVDDREKAIDARLAELGAAQGSNPYSSKYNSEMQQLLDLKAQIPSLRNQFDKYWMAGNKNALSGANVTTEEEAAKFNRIQDLLNSNAHLSAGPQVDPRSGTLDKEQLKYDLGEDSLSEIPETEITPAGHKNEKSSERQVFDVVNDASFAPFSETGALLSGDPDNFIQSNKDRVAATSKASKKTAKSAKKTGGKATKSVKKEAGRAAEKAKDTGGKIASGAKDAKKKVFGG